MGVHVNTISRNNITHLILMESTLFQFGIKTNFSEFFQNKTYMVLMVCHVLQEHEDVIDVIDHKIIQILTKYIIHHMLKNC
jgi:predicted transcriptional regulator